MNILERLQSLPSGVSVVVSCDDLAKLYDHITKDQREEAERLRNIAEQSKIITRKEAAAILGKSEGTLSNWDKSGVLKCFKIGKTPMYYKHEVEGFKNRKQHETI